MHHIVAISGGKDSVAMALRLMETQPRDYIFICTPTGDELPPMKKHWERVESMLGCPISHIVNPEFPTLDSLIRHFNALPNWRQRWCTRILKIEPAQEFYEQHLPCTAYVGLRADEEGRAGAAMNGIEHRYPLREWGWGIEQVYGYLDNRGVEIPERTDCARCYHQRLYEWWQLWKEYPEIYDDAVRQELVVGHTFRSRQRDSWPASLFKMRSLFLQGRVPRKTKKRQRMCRICSM